MCICVEVFGPSMCEENVLIEISPNEECQIMFFYDRLRTLSDVSTEYITTVDSLPVPSGLD